jgi:transcriptional regulator with XRE-family HTH domain
MKECSISPEKMQDIYRQIGKNVKLIRKEKGISQLELSLAIGHKAVGTVSMAEICLNNKHFNIEHLIKIADVLEVNICELFDLTSEVKY